jgi:hypothetical protein
MLIANPNPCVHKDCSSRVFRSVMNSKSLSERTLAKMEVNHPVANFLRQPDQMGLLLSAAQFRRFEGRVVRRDLERISL